MVHFVTHGGKPLVTRCPATEGAPAPVTLPTASGPIRPDRETAPMASSHDLVLTTVPGGNALSPFRAAAHLSRLQRVAPSLTAVSARHVHWVASTKPLDAATRGTVERLLTYGPPDAGEPEGAHVTVVVVAPRLGTLSPWASKATDIAHSCGVDVRRVERVTEYHLAGAEPLPEEQWRR